MDKVYPYGSVRLLRILDCRWVLLNEPQQTDKTTPSTWKNPARCYLAGLKYFYLKYEPIHWWEKKCLYLAKQKQLKIVQCSELIIPIISQEETSKITHFSHHVSWSLPYKLNDWNQHRYSIVMHYWIVENTS